MDFLKLLYKFLSESFRKKKVDDAFSFQSLRKYGVPQGFTKLIVNGTKWFQENGTNASQNKYSFFSSFNINTGIFYVTEQ